MSLDVVSAVQ